jgi:hypothetical protein
VFERVAATSCPAAGSLERVLLRLHRRGEERGARSRRSRAAHHPITCRRRAGSTSRSTPGGTISLWWATLNEWRGLNRRGRAEVEALYGWFDRRPFDEDSREFVGGSAQPGLGPSPYDPIARIYDP